MTLKDQIKIFFKGDILDDDEALKRYSTDASIFSVKPQIVLFPKDSEDIQNIVKFALEKKKEGKNISVTARGAGTCMSGGSLNESIILDTTRYMSGVVIKGKEAVVLPGTFYRDLEKATLSKGLIMPAFPASKNICAVGGMVANDAGGEKTLAYGKTGKYVKEMKAVFSDGNEYLIKKISKKELSVINKKRTFEATIYKKLSNLVLENNDLINSFRPKVQKNSAGYFLWDLFDENGDFDLDKIIVGSQGTLCILTEITFELVKVKEYKKLLVLSIKSLDDIPMVVNLARKYKPESIETYDKYTLKTALKFMPSLIKKMKAKSLSKLFLSFVSEIKMLATFSVPKLTILVEFASDSILDVERRINEISFEYKKMGIKNRIAKNDEEINKHWTIRRESFSLLKKYGRGMRTVPFIDDFIINPEHLPEFLPQLEKILKQYNIIYTIAGHIGDGNFHIIPLMNMKKSDSKDIIIEVSKKVFDLVVKYKGSITAEHNDGIIRTPFLSRMYSEKMIELFKETKNIFDPYNIFNPGKKTDLDLKFLKDHIITDKK